MTRVEKVAENVLCFELNLTRGKSEFSKLKVERNY